jgi:hypothetical protein
MPPLNGLSVQMTAYMDPKDLPQFWELFGPVFEKVIAEPHCTFFEVYQSPEDPGTISWIENWCVDLILVLALLYCFVLCTMWLMITDNIQVRIEGMAGRSMFASPNV